MLRIYITLLLTTMATFSSVAQNLNAFGTSGARFLRITYRDDPATTAVIGWDQVSGTDGSGVVHYGTSPGVYTHTKAVDRTITYRSMKNNYARLTGLTPKTNYYFRIIDSQGQTTEFWFTTQSNDPNDRLAVIAGGDSRNNRTPRRGGNNIVDKLNPHVVWFGGDMIDTDNDAQWVEWFADWTETYNDDYKIIPIVAARGNHETAGSIFNLFDIPSNSEYYALTFGGSLVRLYTMNSEASVTTQGPWLAADLQNNCDLTWKTAQYHRPIIPHEPGKTDRQAQYDNWAHHFLIME
jgi:acid phosphatase type 7